VYETALAMARLYHARVRGKVAVKPRRFQTDPRPVAPRRRVQLGNPCDAGVPRLGWIEDAIGWPTLVAPRADVVVGAMARPALRPMRKWMEADAPPSRPIDLAAGAGVEAAGS
jgi:hypothetical protein